MVKILKYIDKFLKFLKTDRNTFLTYILTLFSIYFVVDRFVEILMMIFTGMSVSYWGPFMYTFAMACPIFAFLFCYGSKFTKSRKDKETFFHLYVIALYIIGISMVIQFLNAGLWILFMSVPNYEQIVMNFPDLIYPAFASIAFYIPMTTAPLLFNFLYKNVNDTQLLIESIGDYGGIKLTKSKEGTGIYACEMYLTSDKETGAKAIIPEQSRFNQFLVVGPSGCGKTSLVFEPMIARDIDKKYFFKSISKEMGFTALRTGLAVLNCPYGNEYVNENFTLNMLTPSSGREDLYKNYMKKMIIGEHNGNYIYRNLGITHISPDYESTSHMIAVAKAYNMPYNIVDPNNPDSVGINPFAYDNPLQTANVIIHALNSMYQGTLDDMQKVYTENVVAQAIENLCILLKVTFPILYDGDKDYLPTLEDILGVLSNFSLVEKFCKVLEMDENLAKEYSSQLFYFKNTFFSDAPKRQETEKCMQYAASVINDLLTYSGVKNIICNRTNNINFEDALANGELTFVCTRRGDLGKSIHKSFGLFFLLLMQNAVLRRPGNENNRIPHFLYIDEFPEFLSSSTESIFTLYRKYRVGATISAQTLSQLGEVSESYKQTILANCINKMTFGNNSIEDNEWWEKEFGNIRYWKFSRNYDLKKGEYEDKMGGIDWTFKSKFKPDKLRSLGFKACAYKYKNNTGSIVVGEGSLDFLQAKYKEQKHDKFYNFDKFSNGISTDYNSDEKKAKKSKIKISDNDPINLDTSDLNIFDNDDAIVFDLKKKKQ